MAKAFRWAAEPDAHMLVYVGMWGSGSEGANHLFSGTWGVMGI